LFVYPIVLLEAIERSRVLTNLMAESVLVVLAEVLEQLPPDSQTARELRTAIQELRDVLPLDPNHPPDVSKTLATLRKLYDELEGNLPVSQMIAVAVVAFEGVLREMSQRRPPQSERPSNSTGGRELK